MLDDYEKSIGVFNFKVLQLKTIEDFKEDGIANSVDTVTELFNFDHEISIPDKQKGKSLHSFDHNQEQRLYLSKDTFRLMEVKNNEMARIYERKN